MDLRLVIEIAPRLRPLSSWLHLRLPTWLPDPDIRDHWRTSADPDGPFFGAAASRRRKTNN